ncbi:MAG: large-conductance mechanosensitive channel protein MscL [Tannerella sp.]|jgi:large conductance mechanosensitive channel|nr:large-conductance mechanosensitive channel protein MscL [Tannerella sp.]
MGFIKEFKEFAMRGNLIDMAVGVVIGGAFGKIVSSIVADIVMPVVSILTGGYDFTKLKYVLKQAVMEGDKVVTPELALNYGSFIQVTLDFLIVAFAVFLVIKVINKIRRKKEAQPAAPAEDIVLLTEIRDLLKNEKR